MLAPGAGGAESDAATALVEAARRVAAEVLEPAAQATDQADVVPASHLRALADAGLFGLFAPDPVPPSVARAVFESLAGACGATFFVWVQHHAPVRLLAASANAELRDRLLPRLTSGEILGGVAFAHLRRPGPPAVAARRGDGGWVITGEAPWATSWGLAGVYAVAALTADERVVFSSVPADARGLEPSSPMRLAVMSATSTVRLGFRDVVVPDADVIVELPLSEWRENDRAATAQPNPAAFGVAGTCVRLLGSVDAAAASALGAEVDDCRTQAYTLADSDRPDLDRLVDLRAWSLDLAMRSAYALVAATGGRSMLLSHPGQRLLREAAFYAIQAQTHALRGATLGRVSRSGTPPAPPPPPPT